MAFCPIRDHWPGARPTKPELGTTAALEDDDGIVHRHPVADADLHGDARALCATLAGDGLKIATGSIRRHFVSYLNGAIVKARVTIVPRTGWHTVNDKKVFALPGEGVGIEGQVILGANVAATHYGQAGTLEEWQNSVAKLAQAHSRARFAIACAFVSPLLMITDSDGGGVNMRGPSTIGKTTLLCAAASVWGRGDERGFIRTWRGTGNGIEAAATQFSDTFLPLDEIGVASGREVGNVVYSMAGGIGKQRANRDGSAKVPNTWRIFILSTGEISIIEKIREGGERARAGQEIRILDIEADAGKGFGVFDTGPTPEQLARELKQAAVTYYGTAGSAFVRKHNRECRRRRCDCAGEPGCFSRTSCRRRSIWASPARSEPARLGSGGRRVGNPGRDTSVANRLRQ